MRNRFAFVQEKDELGVADADGIAVIDDSAADGDSVDEGAVVAVEVDEFKLRAGLLDGAVSPRDYRIGK